MLRFSNELYEALDLAPAEQWGLHKELVSSLIIESLSEIEREVQQKVAAAKIRITELLAMFPKEEHAFVLTARQARGLIHESEADEQINVTCPVCGDENALCLGEAEIRWEPDFEIGDEGETYVAGVLGTKFSTHGTSAAAPVTSTYGVPTSSRPLA